MSGSHGRFNGAVDDRRRKERLELAAAAVGQASMGPSMIVDGKGGSSGAHLDLWIGFNGAVDDRRRKGADNRGGHRIIGASMGPSMIVDGKSVPVGRAFGIRGLQWGRR